MSLCKNLDLVPSCLSWLLPPFLVAVSNSWRSVVAHRQKGKLWKFRAHKLKFSPKGINGRNEYMCVPEITTVPSTASPFLSSGSPFWTDGSRRQKEWCDRDEYLDLGRFACSWNFSNNKYYNSSTHMLLWLHNCSVRLALFRCLSSSSGTL